MCENNVAISIIEIAEKHANNDSAKLCIEDAKSCIKKENYNAAKSRALTSLLHSVGVFHEDYKLAKSL